MSKTGPALTLWVSTALLSSHSLGGSKLLWKPQDGTMVVTMVMVAMVGGGVKVMVVMMIEGGDGGGDGISGGGWR